MVWLCSNLVGDSLKARRKDSQSEVAGGAGAAEAVDQEEAASKAGEEMRAGDQVAPQPGRSHQAAGQQHLSPQMLGPPMTRSSFIPSISLLSVLFT